MTYFVLKGLYKYVIAHVKYFVYIWVIVEWGLSSKLKGESLILLELSIDQSFYRYMIVTMGDTILRLMLDMHLSLYPYDIILTYVQLNLFKWYNNNV